MTLYHRNIIIFSAHLVVWAGPQVEQDLERLGVVPLDGPVDGGGAVGPGPEVDERAAVDQRHDEPGGGLGRLAGRRPLSCFMLQTMQPNRFAPSPGYPTKRLYKTND